MQVLNSDVALPPVAVAGASAASGFSLFVRVEHPLRKLAKSYKNIDRNRKFIRGQRAKLKKVFITSFKSQRKKTAAAIVAGLEKSVSASLVSRILASLNWDDWTEALFGKTKPYLSAIAVDGGETTLTAMGIMSDEVIDLMRERAIVWGEQRSAELVGMRYVDGVLVPNPNARWAITDSTRDMLRDTINAGLDEGLSMQELASRIEDSYAFSSSRAEAIARTETAMADMAGTMESYRATPGVIGKEWLTAGDDMVSDDCLSNEAAGIIPLDQKFPAGDDAPPNHVNCRCDIAPSFENETE